MWDGTPVQVRFNDWDEAVFFTLMYETVVI
jgi:hypothetical protein